MMGIDNAVADLPQASLAFVLKQVGSIGSLHFIKPDCQYFNCFNELSLLMIIWGGQSQTVLLRARKRDAIIARGRNGEPREPF